jgi:Tfp pilus assembly protein PilF
LVDRIVPRRRSTPPDGKRGTPASVGGTAASGRPRTHAAHVTAIAVISLAALAAYHDTFSVPFVFDDDRAIVSNPTIRQLWPPWSALSPPTDAAQTVSGRPLLNLSFALNYAVSRYAVWSYHALNLLVHVATALTLFGLSWRTLARPVVGRRIQDAATPLAFATALLWTVHPLQTESVTYVAQRAESSMSLFFLLTLYCFARSTDSDRPGAWLGAAIVTCLLGMACKEAMAPAPLVVLLYDRTFVAGTFREALRRRGWWYGALAGTWLVLAVLILQAGGRAGTVGFTTHATAWSYGLVQCRAIVHYVRLALWPHPLVFDYGTAVDAPLAAVWPHVLLLGLAVAATGWALVRRPLLGFVGATFFLLLAPSSSVVPVVTQTMAEHRMYLPLAAVLALVVLGLHAAVGRHVLAVSLVLALALGVVTARRNLDYRSELVLWQDTAAKAPANPRAHYNLANELTRSGRGAEAIAHYESALRLDYDLAEVHNNFGNALAQTGRFDAAAEQYGAALRANPESAEAHNNLGNVLERTGRPEAALPHYEAALRLRPELADAHFNAGLVLERLGRPADAVAHYESAVRLSPRFVEARHALGNALVQTGRAAEAVPYLEEVVRLRPDDAQARKSLELARRQSGR